MGVFEFERVKFLIDKYLKLPNATIIDVGGGTGKYSEWLANKGHKVHLIEPVRKHVDIAQNRAENLKSKFSVHLGEARKLGLEIILRTWSSYTAGFIIFKSKRIEKQVFSRRNGS